MQLLTGIPTAELEARRVRLLEYLTDQGLAGCVLFDDRYVQYFTGFNSDTVVVTGDGIDILTSYPKDIESLTIQA